MKKNIIWWGWLSGWIFIILFCVFTTIGFLAGVRQAELPMDYLTPLEGVLYSVPFFVFLFAIRGFARSRSDGELEKVLNTLIAINLLETIFMAPYLLPRYFDETFLTLILVSTILLLCVNGIVLLRLANQFNRYAEEYGARAKRVVWSSRIAGWMLASIVLFIPGFFAAILSEFFLWRFLASLEPKATGVAAS